MACCKEGLIGMLHGWAATGRCRCWIPRSSSRAGCCESCRRCCGREEWDRAHDGWSSIRCWSPGRGSWCPSRTGFRDDAIAPEALERVLRAELGRGRTVAELLAELHRPDSEFSLPVVRATLVGETYFFRHPEHFRFIAREGVPADAAPQP